MQVIKAYCKSNELSLAAFFRAIYGIVLNRYFDSTDDFAIYDVIGARPEGHQHTVGCFYYILPVIFSRKLLMPDAVMSDYLDYIKKYREKVGLFQYISIFLQRKILNDVTAENIE